MLRFLADAYTVSVMIAMICFLLYYFKVESIITEINIDRVLKVKTCSIKELVKTILLCVFCPIFNILFSIIAIMFVFMYKEEAVMVVNKILEKAIEEQEEKLNETTDSE